MDGDTQYGFRWTPITVERTAELPEGRKMITVRTDAGVEITVYASKTGRSLRVFRRGKELKS